MASKGKMFKMVSKSPQKAKAAHKKKFAKGGAGKYSEYLKERKELN